MGQKMNGHRMSYWGKITRMGIIGGCDRHSAKHRENPHKDAIKESLHFRIDPEKKQPQKTPNRTCHPESAVADEGPAFGRCYPEVGGPGSPTC